MITDFRVRTCAFSLVHIYTLSALPSSQNANKLTVIMATSVTLGVRLIPSKFQRIKIENVNLDSKVDLLKDEAAKKINVQKQTIGE